MTVGKNEFLREQLELLKRKRKDADITWQDITDFRFEYKGFLENVCTVRKGYLLLKEYLDAGWVAEPSNVSNAEGQNPSSDEVMKLKKEQIKVSDQRVELNRMLREQARRESFLQMVRDIICKDVPPLDITVNTTSYSSDSDLLCQFSDVHTGIHIQNWKNTFNEDVLKERVEKYVGEVLSIQKLHKAQDCYIVIGEILSGLIHNNLRLQNNMNLMEQFKFISELIADMLIIFAENFNHVYMYTTPGNHSRIVAKKDDSLDGENMDLLLPFYLSARLQNIKNISICENKLDPEIAMFKIRGNNVFSAHGHKDSPSNVVQNFTMMFGIKPDIVLLGHRHTNGLTTIYDAKVIESGCVCGADQYATSIRKTNKPEQTVSVVNENGLRCLYDIQL
nr:MAG TPA: DNA polymerase II small subunit [Caudoviricetes sp.]